MDISVRFTGGKPASIVELTVSTSTTTITEDIAAFGTSKIDEQFIDNLQQVLNELKEHNEEIGNK